MLNITQYEQLEKAYGKTLREIASDSDSWKRFLDSAGYTYRQSFKNQVAMYSQKPGMKAVLTEKRWEDMNRAVKSGTTGVRIFDDKSPNHISYVFDCAGTVPGSPPLAPVPGRYTKTKPELHCISAEADRGKEPGQLCSKSGTDDSGF